MINNVCKRELPRVTIGIPFYNAERTLIDAIRSIYAQTYQDWELILVDDGSTDRSLEIASSIRDSRIRVFSDGINRNIAYRLNQIAVNARSSLLARMDADDLMHPDRLKTQVEYLVANPKVDVLGSGTYVLDSKDKVVGILGSSKTLESYFHLMLHNAFIHPTTMMKTSWARRNPYSMNFPRAEDAELWCRTVLNSHFSFIPNLLYYYRADASFSYKKYANSTRSGRAIYRIYGPQLVGFFPTIIALTRSYCQTALYGITSFFRCHGILLNMRNNRIPNELSREAEEIVAWIRLQRVPGL